MNIEKELSIAFEELDPVTLDKLTEGIDLPADPFSAGQITKRICKKEKTTMKGTIKKKSTALIIALAAAMTLGITAGAATYAFDHGRSIGSFLGQDTAKELESRGLINGQVIKGKHFDITIDTALFNGKNFCVIATAAPTDEYGEKLVSDSSNIGPSSGLFINDKNWEYAGAFAESVGAEDGMLLMSLESELYEYAESITLPLEAVVSEELGDDGEKIAEFDLTLEKNFDNIKFASEDGEQLELWDFGLKLGDVQFDPSKYEGGTESEYKTDDLLSHIELEYADGSTAILDDSLRSEEDDIDIGSEFINGDNDENIGHINEAHLTFGHLIDSKSVTAVTICGKRFTVQ